MNVMYRYDTSGTRTPPAGNGGQVGLNIAQPTPLIDPVASPPQLNGDYLVARHNNLTNVLWCDGHVKTVSLDSLISKKAADGLTLAFFTT